MAKHGKKYDQAMKLIEQDKFYNMTEAAALIRQVAYANFDESLELHANLGIDPRQADQAVRSSVVLPNGTGKVVRVLVFAEGEAVSVALKAGADYAGTDEYVTQINGGWLEFDATVAMADQMGKVGGLGRILGRRGLMPNPRTGTVVRELDDLPGVIGELKGGRVEFRNDRNANVHVTIGKKSFDEAQIKSNVLAVVDAINQQKPSSIKGVYVKSLSLATTMSPGITLDVNSVLEEASAVAH